MILGSQTNTKLLKKKKFPLFNSVLNIKNFHYLIVYYTIYLRDIIGYNLSEINILINYFLKINNIKNIKWVKDLNKIIKNFI